MIRAYDEYGNVYDLPELKKQMREEAIDDLVRFANTNPSVEMDDGEIRPMWLEEMAELVKRRYNP